MRPRLSNPAALMRLFLRSEASSGLVLMSVALLALVIANSPLSPGYFAFFLGVVGGMSLLHWINDGLMAIFFLLVGMEIKREFLEGQLATWSDRALPVIAAAGGMIIPALMYVAFNRGPEGAIRGWAIPMATDIAFALGVLSLLGPRVPPSLKVFLTALAIIDDLGAVLVIAVFYTAGIELWALGGAMAVLVALFAMNRFGVVRLLPYLALGVVLWYLMLRSGVHATVAGVLVALALPLRVRSADQPSPLLRLEHALAPWTAFAIVPLFGFANAGVSFSGVSIASFGQPVPLGIAAGLFLGKQAGVFLFSWCAIRLRLAVLPLGTGWDHLYGMALLCGIGFTMSLFIGLLAFEVQPDLQDATKIGVLFSSVLSAATGVVVLRRAIAT